MTTNIRELVTSLRSHAEPTWAAQTAPMDDSEWPARGFAGATDMILYRASETVCRQAGIAGSAISPAYTCYMPERARADFLALAAALGVALEIRPDALGNLYFWWGPGVREFITRCVG